MTHSWRAGNSASLERLFSGAAIGYCLLVAGNSDSRDADSNRKIVPRQ